MPFILAVLSLLPSDSGMPQTFKTMTLKSATQWLGVQSLPSFWVSGMSQFKYDFVFNSRDPISKDELGKLDWVSPFRLCVLNKCLQTSGSFINKLVLVTPFSCRFGEPIVMTRVKQKTWKWYRSFGIFLRRIQGIFCKLIYYLKLIFILTINHSLL